MKQRQPSAAGVNEKTRFTLEQNLEDLDKITYTLWRHYEGGGVICVDTFRNFNDASKEAQELINKSLRFSRLVNS